MTISLPATASVPGLKAGPDWKPVASQEAQSDTAVNYFAPFFLQPPVSLPDMPAFPAEIGVTEQGVDQRLSAEAEEAPEQEVEANAELPGMATSLLIALLNLPQQAAQPGAAMAALASGTPLASSAMDAVRAAQAPSVSAPQQSVILPNPQAASATEPGLPSTARAVAIESAPQPGVAHGAAPTARAVAIESTPQPDAAQGAAPALRVVATEIVPQSAVTRGPAAASAALVAEAREPSVERGNSSATPASIGSAPSVKLDDTALPSLRLSGTASQWQQPLRQALGEQLQVQLGRGSEQAIIRLSPPMLGRIDISIRHEAGVLQVHMSASHSEVLRQLQGIGDGLRQDLSQRHQYNDVAVVVSPQTRQGDAEGRQRQEAEAREQQPGRALADAGQADAAFALLTENE